MIKDIKLSEEKDFDLVSTHPLQSFRWGEFRKQTDVKVIRKGLFLNSKLSSGFQLTIHKVPHTPWTIGYLPKGNLPNKEIIDELKKIGKEEKCIFIQLEPDVEMENGAEIKRLGLKVAAHPLFTRYTFQLNLVPNEEELLKNMHPKTRYNIKVALKHGVKIVEDSSEEAFQKYLELMNETTKRQSFHAHDQKYHKLMWETLRQDQNKHSMNGLTAHLFLAKYQSEVLAAWIVFVFQDTLYYPYGASSSKNRETMASNLMMWEVIKFGKKMGLKKFDMWGALGPNAEKNDPWFGFHRFKEGYGGKLIEFVGSYDLVINPLAYFIYKFVDIIRKPLLKLKAVLK